MASLSVARPRRLPQPGKLQVYQQQASINLALENVVLGCQQLQPLNIISRGFLTLYANMAEELRALINRRILEDMNPVEFQDLKHFQGERLKWESRPYPRIVRRSSKSKKSR